MTYCDFVMACKEILVITVHAQRTSGACGKHYHHQNLLCRALHRGYFCVIFCNFADSLPVYSKKVRKFSTLLCWHSNGREAVEATITLIESISLICV